MNFVFYNIGQHVQIFKEEISVYLSTNGKKGMFYFIQDNFAESIPESSESIFFYLYSDRKEFEQVCKLTKKDRRATKSVALCKDYEEGILALEDGNQYALLIPVETEKIKQCCEHFCGWLETHKDNK